MSEFSWPLKWSLLFFGEFVLVLILVRNFKKRIAADDIFVPKWEVRKKRAGALRFCDSCVGFEHVFLRAAGARNIFAFSAFLSLFGGPRCRF